jgi:predicted RNA-binding Zn ribbon-like protein
MSDRAPGELELVRLFVNTLEIETGEDELSDPAALQAWLKGHRLVESGSAASADLDAARGLREALRSLLVETAGAGAREEAAETLSAAADRARLALRFDPYGGVRLEPGAAGLTGALGRLVAIAAEAMADGTWTRLKACRAEACRWAFYDHARNRSRQWCSMAVCGNRTKARSYRRRHAA